MKNKMEDFIARQRTESTKQVYSIALNQFFKWKNTTPDKYIIDITKMSNGKKEAVLRQYKADITGWWDYITKTWTPKYTRNVKLNAVRQLLIEYEIELPVVFWKRLKSTKDKGAMALTQDRDPTRAELRQILNEGSDMARTMFLVLSSTGMRMGELLKLTIDDIDLTQHPVWINIPGNITKTGDPRTVYLTDEASRFLKAWLKTGREKWLKESATRRMTTKRLKQFKPKERADYCLDAVFPITRQTLIKTWNIMLQNAHLDMKDKTTGLHVLHAHTLRKYFRCNMIKPLGTDVVEALMGHRGYLTQAYRRYSKSQLAQMFIDAQQHITIIEDPVDIKKLETTMTTKLQEKDREIEKMKAELTEMRLTILELKTKMH